MSESTPSERDRQASDAVGVEDVYSVFEDVRSPALTTRDVTAVLGCSAAVARRRLEALHEAGRVERRKSGNVVLWWAPEVIYGRERAPPVGEFEPIDMGETDAAAVAGHTTADTGEETGADADGA